MPEQMKAKGSTVVTESEKIVAERVIAEREAVDELEAYRRMVAEVAAANDGRVIMNRTAEHAAIVIENVFRYATRDVGILTEHLHAPIYGTPGVLAAIASFLSDPSHKLRVVAEKAIDPGHPFLSAVTRLRPAFKARVMPLELEKQTPFHFSVADSRCFRFEPDKTKYAAYGRFGVPEIGEKLTQTFERLYAKSVEE